MIAIDNSELASDSRLPDIPDAQSSDVLEKLTGADVLISPLNMPVVAALLPRHVKAGALLIQRKSGGDLPSSVGSRLYTSLARMRATGARSWQCILLITGFAIPDPVNNTTVMAKLELRQDGRIAFSPEAYQPMSWDSVDTSMIAWTEMGGVTHVLPCDDAIPGWCLKRERRLKQKQKEGKIREIWPDGSESFYDPPAEDDPLQEPVEVRDWRHILARFKNIGPVRATALRDAMLEFGAVDTLFQALCWATWPRRGLPKVEHWGAGTIQNARDTLGVPDGFDITLEIAEKGK